ncbi:hypothetical protein J2S74_005485 [Evansella vedderi]|uniref:Uncharacterized protein n=1 Tax=Evansella vedderi TaxID=38282 RepID=A0ABU0A3G1_9BACI|nr:hypothetical protein [Evansella vedderi]
MIMQRIVRNELQTKYEHVVSSPSSIFPLF